MPRGPEIPPDVLEALLGGGPAAQNLPARMRLLQSVRTATSPEHVDQVMLEHLARSRGGLHAAQVELEELRALLRRLTDPPLHTALFLASVAGPGGLRALVAHGQARRLIEPSADLDMQALNLRKGDEVLLSNELNLLMGVAPSGVRRYGELATFVRRAPDGGLVLAGHTGEEFVVDAAATLDDATLTAGDPILWNRAAWLALERLPKPEKDAFMQTELPAGGRECIGGQDANLDLLVACLGGRLVARDVAARYGLTGRQSVLLVGPPGCGKTLLARTAVAELGRLAGQRCRLAVVKPGQFEDPFVGVTQQNIRNCFDGLRRAADEDCAVVLFLDEVESFGRTRGGLASRHADTFLAALLAELDGFAERAGVAVIAATNRKDLVDAALLERLSDLELAIARPDMRAARRIFDIHLAPELAYDEEAGESAAARAALVDLAVGAIYTPNADNALCTLRFRDGRTRTIAARELASGRCFEQICRAARRTAFYRELRGGRRGLGPGDMRAAVADALGRLSTTLTPASAHAYLPDLPQDADVVAVEPLARRGHAYPLLNVA